MDARSDLLSIEHTLDDGPKPTADPDFLTCLPRDTYKGRLSLGVVPVFLTNTWVNKYSALGSHGPAQSCRLRGLQEP